MSVSELVTVRFDSLQEQYRLSPVCFVPCKLSGNLLRSSTYSLLTPWGHSKENLPGTHLVDFLCAPHGANTTPVRESDTPLWMCYALFYALAVFSFMTSLQNSSIRLAKCSQHFSSLTDEILNCTICNLKLSTNLRNSH